jgi:DNA-binding response OmpR family regulator
MILSLLYGFLFTSFNKRKSIENNIEINFFKKECELLITIVVNPFQIIKREKLTKKV